MRCHADVEGGGGVEVAGHVVVVNKVMEVLQRETLAVEDLERLVCAIGFGVGREPAECIYYDSALLST